MITTSRLRVFPHDFPEEPTWDGASASHFSVDLIVAILCGYMGFTCVCRRISKPGKVDNSTRKDIRVWNLFSDPIPLVPRKWIDSIDSIDPILNQGGRGLLQAQGSRALALGGRYLSHHLSSGPFSGPPLSWLRCFHVAWERPQAMASASDFKDNLRQSIN
jgi:hypothetical protein